MMLLPVINWAGNNKSVAFFERFLHHQLELMKPLSGDAKNIISIIAGLDETDEVKDKLVETTFADYAGKSDKARHRQSVSNLNWRDYK